MKLGTRVWYWQGRPGKSPIKVYGIVRSVNETGTLARIGRDEPAPPMVKVVVVDVKRLKRVEDEKM